MLFVLFFMIAVFAIPLSAEVAVRGEDNVVKRAADEVDVAVKRLGGSVSDGAVVMKTFALSELLFVLLGRLLHWIAKFFK